MFTNSSKILMCPLIFMLLVVMCLGDWEHQDPQSRLECQQAGCAKSCSCLVVKPKNCLDILHNGCDVDGVYRIFPNYHSLNFRRGIDVFCDQTTEGGGWVVFQRRMNGSVDFNRNWVAYKYGFGDVRGEFWLGNEILHIMASDDLSHNIFRVDMETIDNQTLNANYKKFSVASESNHYALYAKLYYGNAGDPYSHATIVNFLTADRDPSTYDLPYTFGGGGWWFFLKNNMNGEPNFYPTWMEDGPKLKRTEIKFR